MDEPTEADIGAYPYYEEGYAYRYAASFPSYQEFGIVQWWGCCEPSGDFNILVTVVYGDSPSIDWTNPDYGVDRGFYFSSGGEYVVNSTHPGFSNCDNGDTTIDSLTFYLIDNSEPTPTPSPSPSPTPTSLPVVCSKRSVSDDETGYAYFLSEGIGLRALTASYYLDYYSCTDGFFEFRTNNQTICVIYDNAPNPITITGWAVQLSLLTAGTGNSWFGPSSIPSCGRIAFLPPGGYDLCGSPASNHFGPKPGNAFFDSISVVIIVDTGFSASATYFLDRTFGL